MKSFIVLALFVAAATAAPASPDADAEIRQYVNDNIGFGGFKYAFETSNGISASQEGQPINAGTDKEAVAVRGQYSHTGPDGVVYTVTYIADENGFQAQGAHLPVGP